MGTYTFQAERIGCSYCSDWFETQTDAVRHCMGHHSEEKIAILYPVYGEEAGKFKCRKFNVYGRDVQCAPDCVFVKGI